MTHQTFMIGEAWTNVRNLENRQFCSTCNQLKTMSHILLECNANARRLIWTLAEQLWPQEHHPWPEIMIGTILGIRCIKFLGIRPRENGPGERTPKLKGRPQLLQILISEASHLIWTICCRRVINNKQLTTPQIEIKWRTAINNRLTTDKITATKIRKEKQYTRLIKDMCPCWLTLHMCTQDTCCPCKPGP